MKYNRIDIKMWLVSTSVKINIEILSNSSCTTCTRYLITCVQFFLFQLKVFIKQHHTVDEPQPSILSDCNFNSSAGEVSGTQGLWEGGLVGTSVRDPESQERAHESLKGPIDILFWFFHYYFVCIFNSNPQFWEKFQSVLGPQSSIVPPCKISLVIFFCSS
jgi:hypothetical protein